MAARFTSAAYVAQPIAVERGIPIFSATDRYVENYQQIASDHLHFITKGEAQNPFIEAELWHTLEDSTREILLEHVPGNSRILDVGVGLGRLLGPLQQYDRFGVDISLDYLERAQATGIEVAFARIEDMPYTDSYFDAVLVCDVLEHVLDLNLCCKQILRVLKPGGLLIVRVPYREDLSGYLSEANVYEYVHLRNFDEYSIRLFFERIMECEVLSVQEVAPHLVGAPRLKLRQLPANSPVYSLLREEIPPPPPLPQRSPPVGLPQASLAVLREGQEPARGEASPEVVTTEISSAAASGSDASLTQGPAHAEDTSGPAHALSPVDPDVHARSEVQVKPEKSLEDPGTVGDPGLPAIFNPVPPLPHHPLDLLKRAMAVSEMEFINWIYDLKDNHPDWYRKIAPHVVYGIEMNVLVRKPYANVGLWPT